MDHENVRKKYKELTRLLIKRGLTITTMESATAGQIASLITDTEGSSAVLKGAFVTYCNEAKIMQGVPAKIIEKYSVYSKETACAMAQACRRIYGADIGIGVTGTMGNTDPANPDASVPGEIYFALAVSGGAAPGEEAVTASYHVSISPLPTRLDYKMEVAELVCDRIFEVLTGGNEGGCDPSRARGVRDMPEAPPLR